MSSRIFGAPALLLLLLAPHSAFAQTAHTNFAGRWVLDTARSEHGPLTPSAMQLTIEQSGDTIHAATHSVGAAGESNSVSVYDLAGRPTRNTANRGGADVVMTTTTTWNGPALALKTVGELQGQPLTQTSVWTLADDGKTLQLALTIDVAGQHLVAHWLLAKSAGGA